MPHFIFIQGNLGAGKTLSASIMAHYYKSRVESRGGRLELFSNYGLKGSHDMKDYTDWYKVADAQGSICVWDEAQRIFDSRQALKGQNIIATHLLMYVRKLGSVQIFVSPSILNIDTRIRSLTEVLINVRKIGNKGIRLEYFDYQAQNYGSFGKMINTRFISSAKLREIYKLKLYDTHTLIQGFPLPRTERQANEFFKELEERHEAARRRLEGVVDINEYINHT